MRVVRDVGHAEFDNFVETALAVVNVAGAPVAVLAPALERLRNAAKRCVDAGVFAEVES